VVDVLVGFSEADRRRIAMITQFAVDQLWYRSPDCLPDDERYQGCCPSCCGPCSVLKELLDAGQLDAWLLARRDLLAGTSWWDDKNERVDRDWLARSWGNADQRGCHELAGEEVPVT
jgi:hypothetical protein